MKALLLTALLASAAGAATSTVPNQAVTGKATLIAVTSFVRVTSIPFQERRSTETDQESGGQLVGQEQENQLAESQDKDQPKPRVKARRLPTYYSRVVTQTQRESIYEIQDRYDLEIQKIEAQILEKVKERDQEVEKILEPDQLAQVKRWTEEAKQRRAGRDSQR